MDVGEAAADESVRSIAEGASRESYVGKTREGFGFLWFPRRRYLGFK